MRLFERASCVEACKTRPSAATLPIGASHTSLKTCTSKLMTARADAPHPASAGVGGARPRIGSIRDARGVSVPARAAQPPPAPRPAMPSLEEENRQVWRDARPPWGGDRASGAPEDGC